MTREELKRDYVAICGPFPEPLDRHPEEKLMLGKAIALFKKHGTKIHLERRKINGGKNSELMLWREKAGCLIGDEGKNGVEKRIQLGHKQTAKMPVVHRGGKREEMV